MKQLTVLFVATAAVLATAPSFSQGQSSSLNPARVEQKFAALDRNDDQHISKSEAAADRVLARRFAAVDADADGYLSRPEYRARPEPKKFE